MSNIVNFPSKNFDDAWLYFEKKLDLSERTSSGMKNSLNVWDEWQDIADDCRFLGCDPISEHEGQFYLASSLEGAAALCSKVYIHDVESLSALGDCFIDGHALFISKDEFSRQLRDPEKLSSWLREGFLSCANQALGQSHSGWNVVEQYAVRKALEDHPSSERFFNVWHPDSAQDAWRYASSVLNMCPTSLHSGLQNVEECDMEESWIGEEWTSFLKSWNNINEGSAWQALRIKKYGLDEMSALLCKSLPSIEGGFFKQKYIDLFCANLSLDLDREDKAQVVRYLAQSSNSGMTREDLQKVISSLSSSSSYDDDKKLYQRKNKVQCAEYLDRMKQYFYHTNWLDHKDPKDRAMSLAVYLDEGILGENKNMRQLLAQEIKKYEFNDEDFKLLAQCAPTFIDELLKTKTPTLGVFRDFLRYHPCRKWEMVDDTSEINIEKYMNTINIMIKHGWADGVLDLSDSENNQMWFSMIFDFEMMADINNVSAEGRGDYWVDMINEVGNKDLLFATHIFTTYLNKDVKEDVTSPFLEKFAPYINWSHRFDSYECGDEMTVAEAVLRDNVCGFKLKSLAQRAHKDADKKLTLVQGFKN